MADNDKGQIISDADFAAKTEKADVIIYTGDFTAVYKDNKELFDGFKAVQNKKVCDTVKNGASDW